MVGRLPSLLLPGLRYTEADYLISLVECGGHPPDIRPER